MSEPIADSIAYMWENCRHPLSLSDIAAFATYSKFHFARMFRRETGLSPGRFLSNIRITRSKQLLATSTATVSDIATEVGYQSVGTFTTRFAKAVGLTPARYRRTAEPDPNRIEHSVPAATHGAHPCGRLVGSLIGKPERATHTHVSVLSKQTPLMAPVTAGFVDDTHGFCFSNLPCGTWQARAIMVDVGSDELIEHALVGFSNEFEVRQTGRVDIDVELKQPTVGMMPLLVADPGLGRYLSSLRNRPRV